MPVSVVCESTASVNAALRESLGTTNVCTVTSAAIGDDVKAAIVSANGCAATIITNTTDDCDSLQSKLVASTKRVLLTKIEYEEVTNYGQTVLDNLKSKYIVLKPSGHNGEINHNSPAISNNNNHNNSNSNNGAPDINGNTTIIPAGAKLRTNPNELPQPKRILYPREHVRIGWKAVGRKWEIGVGMVNVGNTCYLNSTLQALFHVPSLANWLMSDSAHMERCDSADTGCIICAMAKTLQASQNSQSSIRPYFVYSKLKSICKHLVMGRQEDAHEFLRYLVEAMEKSYLSRFRNFKELDQFSKETTPLNQILGGYLKSAVRCLSCNHVSVTFQHFQDLLLDIRKADTIEEALEGYFSRERLEDMGYKCEACKKKVSATKQFSLERAPIALCIQLKRFSMLGTKLNKQITIKPKLDLTKYASRRMAGPGEHHLTYRLVAMVTHLGASQHCGHYTAIGLTESGTYYNYDDSYVRPISVQNVCNTNAYIIFYEMDTQPTTITTQQQSSCTQVCGGSDVLQTVKMNGHVMNVSSPQRMIGPQLPPSGLRNYSATNGSNITTPTTTTITSTNLLTNGNKLGLNRCPPSPSSSSLTSAASNNNKIMIHFKNNNLTNTTTTTITTTSLKTSTANCSPMVTTAVTSSSATTNNNSNPASYNNYTSNPRGEAASRMVGKKHTTTNANKSSFYSSSDDENGRINSTTTTTTTTLTLTPSKTASQSTLPSMPKLSSDSNHNTTITTSIRTGVSSSQKQKIATIIKPQHLENKKSSALSAPPLLKSLVPYGGSETEEENEAIVTVTSSLEQPTEQCQLPQKRLQTTNGLKRRQSNGGNSVQSKAHDSGSNSDQDETNNDCETYNNERSINKSQKVTQNGSASVTTKRKPADSIDEIFDNVKRSCSSNNIMTQSNNSVTSTTPAADTTSCSSSDEEGALNDSCRIPFNRAQSTPPSPPVIKTKTGLWQVTALSQPVINSKTNKINTPHSVNGKSNSNYVMEKPVKNSRNPFATNNTTRLTTTQLPSLTSSALSMESLNTNGKRFKKDSSTTTANNKTFNGIGYQRETASDSAINELLKQSHRGYGAPVLTWNGQQTEIEREVKAETREQRQRDWQHEEENEMDRGRQKKVKTLKGSHTNNRPPGYNPFQEQQENQNRWKRFNNNHHHHHHTRHYHNPNSAVVGHIRHSFQRNKFKFQRFPHKFSSRRSSNNSNNNNNNNNNNTSGGSGSLNYRRDS